MAIQSRTTNNKKRQVGNRQGGLQRRLSSHGITSGIYLILAAISLAVFGQTIRYEFVNFDDDLYVYNTPAIKAGLTPKGISAAFIRRCSPLSISVTTITGLRAARSILIAESVASFTTNARDRDRKHHSPRSNSENRGTLALQDYWSGFDIWCPPQASPRTKC